MSKKRKNKFANIIIVFVLLVTTIITACVLYEYHRLQVAPGSDILSVLFGFYGGELLIVALRQIFGSDIVANRKSEDNSGL